MNIVKKIAVIIPVLVLSWMFLRADYFQQFQHASSRRLMMLAVTFLVFYAWVIWGAVRRTQRGFFDTVVQASFYVYLFSVLTLTGYFVLFSQVSSHDWWHRTLHRIQSRDGVNTELFSFMRIRHWWTYYGVVGNFVMLLPLGIYLPLLYKRTKNLFTVTFTALLVSVSIELMQLASNFRIADIDDVILNTGGASLGFIIYLVVYAVILKPSGISKQVQAYS